MVNLTQVRAQLPTIDRYTYFNYGGQGLLPQPAIDRLQADPIHLQSLAPFSSAAYDWSLQAIDHLRTTLATQLGTTPDQITLTSNSTEGCNIALWGQPWHPGDHLVMTDCEHQGIIAIVQELQKRFNLDVTIAPVQQTLNGGDPVQAIAQCFTPKTKLVVLSHILWNTGQVIPLEKLVPLCQSQSIQILVDGAQSVGVLPLNLDELGVEYYAFTTHKWWCGVPGIGALYVKESIREALRPTAIGWRSIQTDAQGKPTAWEPGGKRYEISTAPVFAFPATTAAINFHPGSAADRYAQICANSRYLWERLRSIPNVTCVSETPPESGLVPFVLQGMPHPRVIRSLEEQQIFVRLLLDPNCIRACTHYWTTTEECDRLVAAIDSTLRLRP